MGEMLELQDCRRTLHRTLNRLDALGAGIAAIHVNAAIEQLTSNLEMIGKSRSDTLTENSSVDQEPSEVLH